MHGKYTGRQKSEGVGEKKRMIINQAKAAKHGKGETMPNPTHYPTIGIIPNAWIKQDRDDSDQDG